MPAMLRAASCGAGAAANTRHASRSMLADERLLKLSMPGRAYTGPLLSGTVDLARHALVVGDATLREISRYVVVPSSDSPRRRRGAAAGGNTRAFVLCLLPWIVESINSAAAAAAAPDADLARVRTV